MQPVIGKMPVLSGARLASVWLLLGMPVSGQRHGCEAKPEYNPVLVANPGLLVTYVCSDATRLEVIEAVGRQTRLPIGLALGRDARSLLKQHRAYSMHELEGRAALQEAIQGTGYTLHEQDGVLLLVAGDLSRRQRRLLEHRYADFRTNPGSSLADMGQALTMWMKIAAGARGGFVLGGLSSTNEEGFTLPLLSMASTEELANRIVRLGPHGMWIFRASAGPRHGEPTDTVEIESYQHYANRPQTGSEHKDP